MVNYSYFNLNYYHYKDLNLSRKFTVFLDLITKFGSMQGLYDKRREIYKANYHPEAFMLPLPLPEGGKNSFHDFNAQVQSWDRQLKCLMILARLTWRI